ncbi:MAG: GNAT family N-acetyltransferase [Spirochaetes bacterium]|nr:GNAT family N-acetyltransferase [Spirochaetota bacterium]
MENKSKIYLKNLNAEYEERIEKIPFLNIETFIIPSPYIMDNTLEKDYNYSYVWDEDGEIAAYILVYSNPSKTKFQIYKQVTSPFGRGKGIGSIFLKTLASSVPDNSIIYLFVWEKKIDSIDFFESKGFKIIESIVYRQLIFHHMSADVGVVRDKLDSVILTDQKKVEEIGKTRHDAGKILTLMKDMIDMLSIDNFNKVVEDINRESTALVNLLNSYEDKIDVYQREIDIKDIILERVIPYVNASDIPCEIKLHLYPGTVHVYAHYLEVSRALINLASNSLEGIKASGKEGILHIVLSEEENFVVLVFQDNGIGIVPEKLVRNSDGLPAFVGKTTRMNKSGSGIGTRQIFSTFGALNILVDSEFGDFTKFVIRLPKVKDVKNKQMLELRQKYSEFINIYNFVRIDFKSDESSISAFVWQLRKMQIFMHELVFQFSKYNNIRTIYRTLLSFIHGPLDIDALKSELLKLRIESSDFTIWLIDIVEKIKASYIMIEKFVKITPVIRGILLKSYAQAQHATIIFTMDPQTGDFFATDRKLAEHLDFAPYLNKDRDLLLRGEFKGDLYKNHNPIYLGVWSVADEADMPVKFRLIKSGAERLLEMGISPGKRLNFYHTTYNSSGIEIDTYKTLTVKEMADTDDDKYAEFFVNTDDELQGFMFTD